MVPAYGSPTSLLKRTRVILDGPVYVQEKVDGSQLSFGRIEGILQIRSRGEVVNPTQPQKMFALAVQTIRALDTNNELMPEWIYRAEAITKPKHNVLKYERIPMGGIILFDVEWFHNTFLSPKALANEAARLGLEVVPTLFEGPGSELTEERLQEFLTQTSILGSSVKIEGVVIKQAIVVHLDCGLPVRGKVVSDAFKETHRDHYKTPTASKMDFVTFIGQRYATEARWNKAIQHLREQGMLTESPKDIGPILKEIQMDVDRECRQEIMDQLYEAAIPQMRKIITDGFPQYYKRLLTVEDVEDVA